MIGDIGIPDLPAQTPPQGNGSFSKEAWSRNEAAYAAIRAMPFNADLAAGTLSQARFRHYIVQDAHYLIGFGRALALAAAKAPDPDGIVHFARAAETAIVVERSLHEGFFRDFGISAEAFAATPVSPPCDHYVSYLMATAWGEPHEVLLAALLPCFWIYAEIGADILSRAGPGNPYAAWIETYSGEEFGIAVEAMIVATDAAAARVAPDMTARMHRAFARAVQLEWMFWDGAYREAAWPV